MHASVIPALRRFLGHGEGNLNYMYLDNRPVQRKVTTGIGYLIDPLAICLERHRSGRLPWQYAGRRASEQQVRQEWEQVKSMQDFARGRSGRAFEGHTNLNLRLNQTHIEQYFTQTANDYRSQLVSGSQRFAEFDTYPADAQMGILALAWAVGAGRILSQYGQFRGACFRRHWRTAGNQSGWSTATAGRRNQVRQMFFNADAVERQVQEARDHGYPESLNLTQVYFPQRVVTFTRPTRVRGEAAR